MPFDAKLDRPKSLTELAEAQIRSAIIDGRLRFGEQLSEIALAANLGISKTPVREALLRLKLEGLVDIQPQRGSFVFSLTDDEVREICRFREIIEIAALGQAMERDCGEIALRLKAGLGSNRKAGREEAELRRLDSAFHEAILDCCGNAYLQAAYKLISFKVDSLRARLPSEDEHVDACRDNHALICSLVDTGDATAAQESLRRHIRSTEASYLAANRNQEAARVAAMAKS